MRILLGLIACALLTTPLAAAGIDAGATVLEGAASCASTSSSEGHGESWPGGYSYWNTYQQAEACDDSFTYAAAHVGDDAGTLAYAGATAWNGTSQSGTTSNWGYGSSSTWNGSSTSYGGGGYASSSTWSDGWSRTVGASALGASGALTRGCGSSGSYASSDSYAYSSSYEPWGWYDASSSQSSATGSNAHGCHQTASASVGGREARAGIADRCEDSTSESTYASRAKSSDGWSYESRYEESRSDERCRSGVETGGALGDAFVGWESACSSYASNSSTSSGDWSSGSSYESERCHDGLRADGPEGASAFAGSTSSSYESCSYENGASSCSGSSYDDLIAGYSWGRSPLGPSEHWMSLPHPPIFLP